MWINKQKIDDFFTTADLRISDVTRKFRASVDDVVKLFEKEVASLDKRLKALETKTTKAPPAPKGSVEPVAPKTPRRPRKNA
jgi:hypothetical protein